MGLVTSGREQLHEIARQIGVNEKPHSASNRHRALLLSVDELRRVLDRGDDVFRGYSVLIADLFARRAAGELSENAHDRYPRPF